MEIKLGFIALGDPIPQGSKTAYVRNNRAVITEANKRHKPWRAIVKAACKEALEQLDGFETLDEPLILDLTCFIKRPAKPKFDQYPATMPDLSKLVRAVEDSITDAGGWSDDGRVVEIHARKLWANGVEPGVIVSILTK